MDGLNDNTIAERLRRWWLTPPRSGFARLIAPFEYRHIGAFGVVRIVGAAVAAAAGFICLAYSAYGWAAFFLAIAAANLVSGSWELGVARSRSAQT